MQNLRVLLELLHMEAKLRPHESQVQDTKKPLENKKRIITRTCRVIADFQLNVYYLCDLDTGFFLGMAYIPTDKIPMMDRLFRKTPNEEVSEYKMICHYNHKMKKWSPIYPIV